MTLKTTYKTGDILQASDINATNTEVNVTVVALDSKVDKSEGKGLSEEDFTSLEKVKLFGIEAGAQVNPTKTSELTNDSNFITHLVNNLSNYYLKTETYTKNEVNTLISEINQFTYEVASVLPTASASTMYKVYLVPSSSSATQNVKDEFITVDNGESAETRYTWEQIGSTTIDLSNYYTKGEVTALLATKSTVSVSDTGTATDEISYITVDGIEKKLAGGGSGESVFIAEYNTTTWAQLEEAINSGKLIFCKYEAEEEDPVYASLYSVNTESKEAIFSAVWMMPIDVGMEDDVTQYCGIFIMVSADEGETSWLSAPSFGAIPIATSQLTNDSNFASLPTTVNDRYLHTNSSTGALEWSTVTGGSGVFVATYGTTTWNDIYTHLGNGEMVIVVKDNKVYSYVSSTSMAFAFCNIIQASSSEIYASSVYVTSPNTWATINEVQIPVLPTVVNDRYLHTNASTGALEWATVSGGNSVFIAEYNTTSYQDITSAINANKVVLCKYSQNGESIYAPTSSHIRYARLCDINNNIYRFSTIIPENSEDGREVYLDSNHIQVSLNGTQTQWEGYVNLRIIPRRTSQLTNDSNCITSSYHDSTKQNTLVSGNNIKTINNQSILGSGNIDISSGASNVMIAIFDDTAVSDIEVAYNAGKTIIVKDYLYGSEEMWTDNYGRMAYLSDVKYYEEEEEVEEGEYETIQCLRFYFTQVSGREGKTYVYTIDTYEDYWYREEM